MTQPTATGVGTGDPTAIYDALSHFTDGQSADAQNGVASKFSTGLGNDIDDLARKSPTLLGRVSKILEEGWTVTYGEAGQGSYANSDKKTIVIDSNKKGDATSIVRTLAHESSHATYTRDPHVQPTGITKDEYVNKNTMRYLKDEGEATIANLEVRKELMGAKAGDIGVSGTNANTYMELFEKYSDPADRDKLREEIGKVFAHGEVPSSRKKDGTEWKNYEQYYNQFYSDLWDENERRR